MRYLFGAVTILHLSLTSYNIIFPTLQTEIGIYQFVTVHSYTTFVVNTKSELEKNIET